MKTEESLRIQLAQVKKYLDIKDVALLTNFSVSSIRRKIHEGKLKPIQHGKHYKMIFRASDIEKWLEDGTR